MMSENKTYYQTSDGQAFYTPDCARNHARTLPEGKREVKEIDAAEYHGATATTSEEGKKAESSTPSEYDLLKAEAKELGLEFKSNISKAKLVELIAEAKAIGSEGGEDEEEGDTANKGEQ